MDKYKKIKAKNKIEDNIRNLKLRAMEKSGIKIHHATSSRGYSRSYRPEVPDSVKEATNKSMEVAKDIMEGNYEKASHNIYGGLEPATWYNNPAQYTYQVGQEIQNNINNQIEQSIVSLDTEWIGGGEKLKSAPMEIGVSFGKINADGAVENLNNNKSIYVELDEGTSKHFRDLINRMKKSEVSKPLTSEERRSLMDLMKYSGKGDSVETIVNKDIRQRALKYGNPYDYIDQIDEAFSKFEYGKSADYVTPKSEIGKVLKSLMSEGGTKIEDNPIFLWQNGLNSDVGVWMENFGKDKTVKKMMDGQHMDVFSLLNSTIDDPMSLYDHPVSKPLSLETYATERLGLKYSAHIAAEDSGMTIDVFSDAIANGYLEDLTEIRKDGSGLLKKDDMLYSISSIRRNKKNPINFTFEQGGPADYLPANYKNAVHQIVDEFTKEVDGKTVYGVKLKNMDDGVSSIISANSVRDLQSMIQANFMEFNKDIAKTQKINRKYELMSRANRSYNNLFTGRGSTKAFDRTVQALGVIADPENLGDFNNHKYMTYGGVLKDKYMDTLEEKGVSFSRAQRRDFQHSFKRLWGQKGLLLDFKEEVYDKIDHTNNYTKNSRRFVALEELKKEIDRVYDFGKEEVKLPQEVHKYAKIPSKTGEVFNADNRTMNTLTNSFRRNFYMEGRYDGGYDLSDVKSSAKNILTRLRTQGTITTSKYNKIVSRLDNVKKVDQSMGGISYVSRIMGSALHDTLPVDNTIEINNMNARIPKPMTNYKLVKENFSKIESKANNLLVSDGDDFFKTASAEGKNAIENIDKRVKEQIAKYTGMDINNPVLDVDFGQKLNSLAKTYRDHGIDIEGEIVEKGETIGMKLRFIAKERANSVVGHKTKTASEIILPIFNPSSGLIEGGPVPTNNIMNLTGGPNGPRLGTLSGQIIDDISGKYFVEDLSYNLKGIEQTTSEGIVKRVVDAEGNTRKLQKRINRTLSGNPSGSVFSTELIGGLSSSTKSANEIRGSYLDINKYVENITGTSVYDMGPTKGQTFMRAVGLDVSSYKKTGLDERLLDFNKEEIRAIKGIKNFFSENGLSPSVYGMKGERFLSGFVQINEKGGSLSHVDPRTYDVFGTFGSPLCRDSMRSQLNFLKMNEQKIYQKAISNGMSPKEAKRLVSKRAITSNVEEKYANEMISFNVNAAFMNDHDIAEVMNKRISSGADVSVDSVLHRLSTRNDMMVVTPEVARSISSSSTVKVGLDEGVDIDSDILKRFNAGEEVLLSPNDVLGRDLAKEAGEDAVRLNDARSTKYQSLIKDIVPNKNNNGYDVVLEEFRDLRIGDKLQMTDGGTKLTMSVVGSTEMNALRKQLGPEFAEIQALIAKDPEKYSADLISSQFRLFADEALQSGKSGKEIEKVSRKIATDMLSPTTSVTKEQVKQSIGQIKFKNGRLIFPSELYGKANLKTLFDRVNEELGEFGKTNVVHDFGNGETINRALVSLSVQDVYDWTGTASASGEKVKFGARHLQTMRGKNKFSLNGELDPIIKSMEDYITEAGKPFKGEASNIQKALINTWKGKDDTSKLNIIRTSVNKVNDGYNRSFDLTDVSLLERGSVFDASDYKGTVLDSSLHGKMGTDLELPFKVNLTPDDNTNTFISKARLVDIHAQGDKKGLRPTAIQKNQNNIIRNVKEYMQIASTGDEKEVAQARRKLEWSVRNHYQELGKATQYSKGYIAENTGAARLPASGHFNYRGSYKNREISGMIDDSLKEGESIISRKDLRNMLSGGDLSDDAVDKVMKQAQTEGIVGMTMREPVNQYGSMVPNKIKILSESQERVFDKAMGQSNALGGNMYMTLGTIVRQNADHDGDRVGVAFPQFREGLSEKQRKIQAQAMDNWFAKDNKMTENIANEVYARIEAGEIDQSELMRTLKSGGNDITVGSIVKENASNQIVHIESRAQKMVGQTANVMTKVKETSEIVAKNGSDSLKRAAGIVSIVSADMEEARISAKRMDDMVGGGSNYKAILSSFNELTAAAKELDGNRIVDQLKILNAFSSEGGEEIYEGTMKNMGAKLQHEVNGGKPGTASQIIDAFTQVREAAEGMDVMPNSGNVGLVLSSPYSTGKALRQAATVSKNKESLNTVNPIFSAQLGDGPPMRTIGDESIDQVLDNANKQDNIGPTRSNQILMDMIQKAKKTSTAEDAAKAVGRTGIDTGMSLAGKAGMVGAGLAVGGMIASSMINTMENIQKPNETRSDQAPNANGEFVNPKVYAGAPPGAGPQDAYVLPQGSGYDRKQISINANYEGSLDSQRIQNVLNEEINRQMNGNVNLNITSQDNTTNIDNGWIEDKFDQFLNNGRVINY